MGNCNSFQGSGQESDSAAKARSDTIDRRLKEDSRVLRRERKILLLGSSESGKSTIMRQLKIMHQGGFTDDELMTFRPTIYRNTLDSAQAIVLAMRTFGLDCIDLNNRVHANHILDYRIDPSPNFVFSSEIAQAIHQLWLDPIISELMDHSSEFYLMDSAAYFFANVRRIGTPTYRPIVEDVLRVRLKTTGIIETRFTLGQLKIHIFDVGGQSSKRKKWTRCFESVASILFCTALSEYDQVFQEDKNQNRMAESLMLFESVINSRLFSQTSVILFLNKVDVFKTKLPKVPLERYFPEYSGGADFNNAARYILWRFMRTNRARLNVYPHLTDLTDITNFRLVFSAVRELFLQILVKGSGVL